jgi:hypothetical protein
MVNQGFLKFDSSKLGYLMSEPYLLEIVRNLYLNLSQQVSKLHFAVDLVIEFITSFQNLVSFSCP